MLILITYINILIEKKGQDILQLYSIQLTNFIERKIDVIDLLLLLENGTILDEQLNNENLYTKMMKRKDNLSMVQKLLKLEIKFR